MAESYSDPSQWTKHRVGSIFGGYHRYHSPRQGAACGESLQGPFYGVQCVSTKSNPSLGTDLRNLPGAMGQALFLNVTPKELEGKLRLLYGPH